MNHDVPNNPDQPAFEALGPDALIDAYFDRSITPESKSRLARLLSTDPAATIAFGECDRAVEALRAPVVAPDFSAAILDEVGRRRGWLGASLQRLVSIGRLAAAAVLLLALGLTLAAKRWAPDSGVFPSAATPIADVTECAASDADCNVSGIRRALNWNDFTGPTVMSARVLDIGSVRAALVAPAGLTPAMNPADPTPIGAAGSGVVTVRFVTSCDGSLRPISATERVGAVAVVSKPASTRRAATESDKEPAVGGW